MKTLDKNDTGADINIFVPNKKRVKKINDSFFGQFAICLVCLLLFGIFLYKNEIKQMFTFENKKDINKWEINLPFSARRQNILLMGVDAAENPDKPFDNARSDSIYLISIAAHAKDVNVISIPRDSKVYIPAQPNPDKINHAFAFGGIDLSKKTIEQTLGVRIDNYIVVSNQAFIDFIDKIGGVDVYVEKDMNYNDYSADLHINLQQGIRHLNGKDAEGFMRYRKDALGDIGRIRRQQWFLNSLAQKLKDPAILVKMPEIVKSLSKYMQTDFSYLEIAQYAALIKSIDLSRVKVATLPGEPSQHGFISYWILDPKAVQELVDNFVYDEKPKALSRPVEAGILYTQSQQQNALELQKQLEMQGINVTARQVKNPGHSHIAIHSFEIPDDTISNLKSQIPALKDKQTVYDIIGINKIAADFTVILAGSQ